MAIRFLHIFKAFTFILLALLPLLGNAQQVNLDKKININVKDMPLSEVLDLLAEEHDLNFAYSKRGMPLDKQITVNKQNITLKEVVETVFKEAEVEYTIVEKQVILKPVGNKPIKQKKKETHTVSGYLKDQVTGELMIGATVYVEGDYIGTISNSYGFYSLTLPEGIYTLVYSFIGYQNRKETVELYGDQQISYEMETDMAEIETVEINASEQKKLVDNIQASTIRLNPRKVEKMPGLMGESDVIKSLQNLPGIKSFGDGSTSFYVRGGNRDQNLILLDEAPIFNPSHLFGFFSTIVPDAVKDIKIYKGDIPVKYGGRLSSVIDIKTKDGNMKKFGATGSFGLMTNRLAIEGPFKKDRSSYFLAIRNSHLKWLFAATNPNMDLSFKDINAKLNFKINDKNRFYFSFYSGEDYLGAAPSSIGKLGITWRNFAGTLRWNHLINDKFFSNATLYSSLYDYNFIFDVENGIKWNSNIVNYGWKQDYTYYMSPRHTMRFGLEFNGNSFNPGNIFINNTKNLDNFTVSEREAKGRALYISDEFKISDKLKVKAGVRTPFWDNRGPSTIYDFNEEYQIVDTLNHDSKERFFSVINIEPRFCLNYKLNDISSLKACFSHTVQYLHLLSNSISPFTSFEVWVPTGPNIKPEKANMIVAGYFRMLPKDFELSTEVFYKKMYNQIDYAYHANLILNPLIEGELRFGNGNAYGVELMLKKTKGKITGWVGYMYSRTYMRIKDVNNGVKYPAFQDRPHDISLNADYKLSDRWRLTANWVYCTGAPISTPTSFFYYQGYQVPIYASKNNDRLPNYHRLDIAASFQLNKPGGKFYNGFTFSIYNAYNHKNATSINFNKIVTPDGEIVVPSDLSSDNIISPTQLWLLGFIPSITYTFRF